MRYHACTWLDKISPIKPGYICIAETFGGNFFANTIKLKVLYKCKNFTNERKLQIKLTKNFLQMKISTYM